MFYLKRIFTGAATVAATLLCLTTALAQPLVSRLNFSIESSDGSYTITSSNPAWTFSGSLNRPVDHLSRKNGTDAIGRFQETRFQWSDGHPFVGIVRVYAGDPVVLFSVQTVRALSGPTPDFPSFTKFPAGLTPLSFRDESFSPHVFALEQTSTPWILFDSQANTAVISPASDFIVSRMHGGLTSALSSGINADIASLPAGFAHWTILTVGTGVESTIHHWGDALTRLSGKPIPKDDNDLMLRCLGYWTDNGAGYYYNYDVDKGYTGTLLAVRDEYERENIPLCYFQLDSWWYQKSRTGPDGAVGGPKNAKLPEGTWNAYGGTLDYSASPELFPDGLKKFDADLGVPIAVHGRWIDPASPYHARYDISGIAPIDSSYWDDRAKYLCTSGVFCYEQDWLVDIYHYSPKMATDLSVGNAFTNNMARATQANGETMQYCMATPRFFLQGSKYDNLTTIRTSDDYFIRPRWSNFLYTSILADSLHIRPWADVMKSTNLGDLTIATLSTGPVGIGDLMGAESIPNLRQSIRGDGVIIKPDAPLLPTDSTIASDAAGARTPLISSTFTNNGVRTVYVLVFSRPGDSPNGTFVPGSFGLTGQVYVVGPGPKSQELDANLQFTDVLDRSGWALYTIAPVGRSGIAFLGDVGKIVGTGRQRISSIDDEPGKLIADVILSSQESDVTLGGYCDTAPTVSVDKGIAGGVNYNPATRYFKVVITKPTSPGTAATSLADIKVVFSR